MKKTQTLRRTLLGTAAAIAVVGSAWAQSFPTKPISLVVPFAAGGPTDVVARSMAAVMSTHLGQAVVVENRIGAGGTISAAHVAKSAPDGYTLLIHHNGMATAPALYRKLPFSPLQDFEYISQVVDVPMTLIGRKDLPANNLKELLPYLKANAEKINVAHAGLGAVSHLCSLLFRQALGTDFQTVPFGGTAPALNALLGSQVDLLCDQTTNTTSHIKAGTVKMYGVTTPNRIAAMPDQPSLDEQGMKGFQMVVWHGVYAPKGTPPAVLEKLNGAVRAALNNPGFQTRMKELGADVVPESKRASQGLKSWLQAETERLGLVIRSAGTYAD